MDHLRQDLRYAARQLWHSKGFTFVAVLTLALGIGANTAVFTLVNAVMLQALDVPHPEELYRVGDTYSCCVIGGYPARLSIFSYSLYRYFRDHTPEFSEMAAFQAGLPQVSVRRGGASGPGGAVCGPVRLRQLFHDVRCSPRGWSSVEHGRRCPGGPRPSL